MNTIFVSSTFRDMNQERDVIQTLVVPELNGIARRYGTSVGVMDLRWGIDTSTLESEEGSRKVLSVCLDEIDNCRPYMIVLLGERYGWIPSKELIEEAVNNRTDFSLSQLEKSVTALEIEYGALRNSEQLENTLFYFREVTGNPPADYLSEGLDHAAKLAELKQRIMKATHGKVKTYKVHWDSESKCLSGIDAFADMVISDIRNLMEPQWKKYGKMTPYQRDLRGQWDFARQNAAKFAARYHLIERYRDIINGDTALFAIQGPSGSGKTTLMSKLAQELNHQVLPIFCGYSELCNTPLDVLKYILDYLETSLDIPHFAEQITQSVNLKEWQDRLNDVVDLFNDSGLPDIVILTDGVDQLHAADECEKLCFIPSNLSSKIRIILSCLDSFPLGRDIHIEYVPILIETDREEIIRGILAPTGRSLSNEVIYAIASKEGGDNPLYLSLLVARLEMMDRNDFDAINRQGGGMHEINQRQIDIIRKCPSNLDALCVYLVKVVMRKMQTILPLIVSDFIAVSRYGLRQSDLENVFNILGKSGAFLKGSWNILAFSRFLRYMSRFFIKRADGRIDFTHQAFRKGFLANMSSPEEKHDVLLEYFSCLPYSDDIKRKEIGYHCIKADQKEYFISCISGNCRIPEITAPFAKNLIIHSQSDNGQWIHDVIQAGELVGWTYAFTTFLFEDVLDSMIPSEENLKLTKLILEDARELLEKRSVQSNSIDDKRDLAACLKRLAAYYRTQANPQHLHTTLSLVKAALQIDEEIFSILGTSNSRRSLSIGYEQIGLTLCSIGGKVNLQKAVYFLEESLKHRRILCVESLHPHDAQRGLLLILSHLGDIYSKLGGRDDLQKALSYYQESIHISDILLIRNRSKQNVMDLASTYSHCADVLMQMGSRHSLDALKYLEQSAELWQELESESLNTDIANGLALTLIRISKIHLEINGRDHLLAAKETARKALQYNLLLADQLHTVTQENDLAMNYSILGDIYQNLGTIWDSYNALYMYEQAMEIYKKVVARSPSENTYNSLIGVLYKVANHLGTRPETMLKYVEQIRNTANTAFQLTSKPHYQQIAKECEQHLTES